MVDARRWRHGGTRRDRDLMGPTVPALGHGPGGHRLAHRAVGAAPSGLWDTRRTSKRAWPGSRDAARRPAGQRRHSSAAACRWLLLDGEAAGDRPRLRLRLRGRKQARHRGSHSLGDALIIRGARPARWRGVCACRRLSARPTRAVPWGQRYSGWSWAGSAATASRRGSATIRATTDVSAPIPAQ
jgi:hypothetical protein